MFLRAVVNFSDRNGNNFPINYTKKPDWLFVIMCVYTSYFTVNIPLSSHAIELWNETLIFFILCLMRSMKEDANFIKRLLYEYKNNLKICLLLSILTFTGIIQDLQMDRNLYVFKPIIYWHVYIISCWRIVKSVSILLVLHFSNVIKLSNWW